jgi:hypothetical protein
MKTYNRRGLSERRKERAYQKGKERAYQKEEKKWPIRKKKRKGLSE